MTPSSQAEEFDRLLRELASEREARKRQESLWALMPVVASTLDIREIFQRVSVIAKEAIPHDALGIQLYQVERNRVLAFVVSDRLLGEWDYPILRELDEPALDVASPIRNPEGHPFLGNRNVTFTRSFHDGPFVGFSTK